MKITKTHILVTFLRHKCFQAFYVNFILILVFIVVALFAILKKISSVMFSYKNISDSKSSIVFVVDSTVQMPRNCESVEFIFIVSQLVIFTMLHQISA